MLPPLPHSLKAERIFETSLVLPPLAVTVQTFLPASVLKLTPLPLAIEVADARTVKVVSNSKCRVELRKTIFRNLLISFCVQSYKRGTIQPTSPHTIGWHSSIYSRTARTSRSMIISADLSMAAESTHSATSACSHDWRQNDKHLHP